MRHSNILTLVVILAAGCDGSDGSSIVEGPTPDRPVVPVAAGETISPAPGVEVTLSEGSIAPGASVQVEVIEIAAGSEPDSTEADRVIVRIELNTRDVLDGDAAAIGAFEVTFSGADGEASELRSALRPGEVWEYGRVKLNRARQRADEATDELVLFGRGVVDGVERRVAIGVDRVREFVEAHGDEIFHLDFEFIYRTCPDPIGGRLYRLMPDGSFELVDGLDVAGGIPVVMVHGWQPEEGRDCDHNAHEATWSALGEALLNHRGVAPYAFQYSTAMPVDVSADRLREAIGTHEVILVGHSMGGLVSTRAVQLGTRALAVISLGTPFHGSPLVQLAASISNALDSACILALGAQFAAACVFAPSPAIVMNTPGARDLAWDGLEDDPSGSGSGAGRDENSFLNRMHRGFDQWPDAVDRIAFAAALDRQSIDQFEKKYARLWRVLSFFGYGESDGIVPVVSALDRPSSGRGRSTVVEDPNLPSLTHTGLTSDAQVIDAVIEYINRYLEPEPPRGFAPEPPSLLAPADGDTVRAGASVTFRWRAAAGAHRYQLVVCASRDLGGECALDQEQDLVGVTEYTVGALPEGIWYWSVRAIGVDESVGWGDYGPRRQLIVDAEGTPPPPMPVLDAPAEGHSVSVGAAVTFRWRSVPGAHRYLLAVCASRPLGNPCPLIQEDDLVGATQFTTAALPEGTWYWSVRAIGVDEPVGWSDYAPARQLVVRRDGIDPPVDLPPAPILTAPAEGDVVELGGAVTFEWQAAPGVSRYLLAVCSTRELDNPCAMIREDGLTGVTQYTTDALPEGTWYWSVQGIGPNDRPGWSDFAPARRIIVRRGAIEPPDVVPAAPTLSVPAEAHTLRSGNPVTFGWQAVAGAHRYLLAVCSTRALANPCVLIQEDGLVDVTEFTTDALPWGTWFWSVRAIGADEVVGWGEYAPARQIVVQPDGVGPPADPPPAPILTAPADWRTVMAGEAVTFRWRAVPDAHRYLLAVCATRPLGNPCAVIQEAGLVGATELTTDALPVGTWYWSVRAIGLDEQAGWGEYAPARPIIVQPDEVDPPVGPPAAPVLTSPAEGDTASNGEAVTFRWQAVAGANRYLLAVCATRPLGNPCTLIQEGGLVGVTQFTTAALPEGTWYWSVRAIGVDEQIGWGDYAPARQLVVSPRRAAPGQPALTSPAEGTEVALGDSVTFRWQAVAGANRYLLAVCATRPLGNPCTLIQEGGLVGVTQFTTAALPEGTWYWSVRAIGVDEQIGWGDYAPARQLVVSPRRAAPGQPVLSDPDEGTAVTLGDSVTFRWQAVVDASRYLLAVCATRPLGNQCTLIQEDGLVGATEFTTSALPEGTWYWSVRAIGVDEQIGWGEYAPARQIIVRAATPPAVPGLDSPPEGTEVTLGDSITFRWQAVAGANRYLLAVCSTRPLGNPCTLIQEDGLVGATQFTTTALPEGTWYWSVRAIGVDEQIGWGEYAPARRLVVRPRPVAPGQPALTSPAEGTEVTLGDSVTFRWQAVADANRYLLAVCATRPLGNPCTLIQEDGLVGATQFTTTALPEGTWYWSVRAIGVDEQIGWGEYAPARQLIVRAAPPAVPRLSSPAEGTEATLGGSVTFRWQAVAGANRYLLAVCSTRPLGNPCTLIQENGLVGVTEFTTAALPEGTWYWSVRAIGIDEQAGWGDYAPAREIVVRPRPRPPAQPVLSSPGEGTSVTLGDSVTFRWQAVAGANRYLLAVCSTRPLGNPCTLIEENGLVGVTQFTTAALPAGTWYWSVRAIGADEGVGWGEYSPARQIIVRATPPAAPRLSGPAEGGRVRVGDAVTFRWSNVDGARRYLLAVCSSRPLGNPCPIMREAGLVGVTEYTTDALSEGTWYWSVRAIGADEIVGWGQYAASRQLVVEAPPQPPSAPRLRSPGDPSSSDYGAQVTFQWDAVATANRYMFALCSTRDLRNPCPIIQETGLVQTTQHSRSDLPVGTWYWTVRAIGADENVGWGPYASARRIDIPAIVPPAPSLGAPSEGASYNRGQQISFSWNAARGARRYMLAVCSGRHLENPCSLIQEEGLVGTTVFRTAALAAGTKYWAVRAIGPDETLGWGPYSSVRQVTIR